MAKRGPKGPSKYTNEFIEKEAQELLNYANQTIIPFEFQFAPKRGYHSQRLSEWAEKSEKFSEALKKFKDIQKYKIIIAAMANKINPSVAIFTLKNVAGWRDDAGAKAAAIVNLGIGFTEKIKELEREQIKSDSILD